jgi:hypothetical protein
MYNSKEMTIDACVVANHQQKTETKKKQKM